MHRGLVYYMSGVIFWGVLASALTFGRALLIAAFSRRASRAVHDQLCEKVLVKASTSHFDRTPVFFPRISKTELGIYIHIHKNIYMLYIFFKTTTITITITMTIF